jgi:signal recognition particle subunit SRP54
MAEQVDERELIKTQAMIQSMTPGERTRPERIDKSRANRIARGSGRSPREVLDLVGRFRQMREMMGALGGGGGLLGKIPGMGRLAGAGAPAGFDPAALLGGGNRKLRRQQEALQKSAGKKNKKKRKQAKKSRRRGRR